MEMLQLQPALPVLTPHGKGWAHLVINAGLESHLMWVVAMDETGEVWTLPNWMIRFTPNCTAERFMGNDFWMGVHKEWGVPAFKKKQNEEKK